MRYKVLLSAFLLCFSALITFAQTLDTGPVGARFRFYVAPSSEKQFSDSRKLGFQPGYNEGWEPPYVEYIFDVVLDERNQFSHIGSLRTEEKLGFDGRPSRRRGGTITCTGKVDFESWTFHMEVHYVKSTAYGTNLQDMSQEESAFFSLDGPLAYPAVDSSQPRWSLFKVAGSVACKATFGSGPFLMPGTWDWTFPLELRADKDDIACYLTWKSPYSRTSPAVAKWEKETGKVWKSEFTQKAYLELKQKSGRK